MKTLRNLGLSLAALSLAATPVIAKANEAASARQAAEFNAGEALDEGGGDILYILIGLALVVGIILLAGGDDDEDPVSP